MTDQEIRAVVARGTFNIIRTQQGGVYGDLAVRRTIGFCYDPERITEEPIACVGVENDRCTTVTFNVAVPGGLEGVFLRVEDIVAIE